MTFWDFAHAHPIIATGYVLVALVAIVGFGQALRGGKP